MTQSYTEFELREMIKLAKALGFQDDVEHWTAELQKLNEKKDA